MFHANTDVKAVRFQLERRKPYKKEVSPWLNVLYWQEEGSFLAHCLELDIAAEGATSQEVLRRLAELIVEQIEFAEGKKIDIFHSAPKEFWDKLLEIHLNHVKQQVYDHPPRSAREILKSSQLVHA